MSFFFRRDPPKSPPPATPLQKVSGGFDFTSSVRLVCEDMVARLPELAHIDLTRVAVSFSQARNRSNYGLFASLTPMRFQDGAEYRITRGRQYTIQRLHDRTGREMLYILSFCLPRFMDLIFREKLITILHEMWHISPHFNGDIRRHPGRCYAHTHSQEEYDEHMGELADHWLTLTPPESIYSFLKLNFNELQTQHGRLFGVKISRPKLLPVPNQKPT